MNAQPFTINIAQDTLDDFQYRLAHTRWPSEVKDAGWDYGTNTAYLKELVTYWKDHYDWRKQEAALNQFDQFTAEVDGQTIHFIHQRGKGKNPTPIIITHGWPDSFYRMVKLIPLLTDSFDVIVPSIPGFGFSPASPERGMTLKRVADLWSKLMTDVLGYKQYAAAGGDFGSRVTRLLALNYPKQVIGIHLTDIGYPGDPAFATDLSNLSPNEQQYLNANQGWFFTEGAYAMIQSTKPQTLAVGLNDSPAGLASWIVEKFRTWSDCDGDVEKRFTKDELLTNIMIYWLSESIPSSVRAYLEDGQLEPQLKAGQHIEVPAALARFPKDLGTTPPQELADRYLRIQRWTEFPRGGHFAALEEPELLADDMKAFFRDLKKA